MQKQCRPRLAGYRYGLGSLLTLALVGCGGGGGGGSSNTAPSSTYSITASVQGLNSGGLVLLVNATQVPVSSGATSVTLASMLNSGTAYTVTVQSQPTGETCSVTNGSGTVSTSNVTNVGVNCPADTFTVGGTISGLTAVGLVLLNNEGDPTPIAANATQFVMNSPIAYGGSYSITVKTPPGGETCQISQGSGSNITTNIDSVAISCAPGHAYTSFTETVIYSFTGGDDGADPTTALTEGTDGYLYGTTSAAGANGSGGTVFKITTAGVLTVLHSFKNDTFTDGSVPSGLIQGTDGSFYGVTTYGGATGGGTVFKVTPTGTETILYSFVNGVGGDGFNPSGNLIQATNGNFYGTAPSGGAQGNGVIFEITPSGQETILHSFNASANDGYGPSSGVIQASDGNLYGTTPGYGANVNTSFGAVFEVTLSGQETVLYTFKGPAVSDGQLPEAGLIQGGDGNFYGTTSEGGVASGTVFKLTPGGVETVLSNFNAGGATSVNGYSPISSLVQASDGNLYGTNSLGGANNDGTVFQSTPQGATTLVYAFGANAGDGSNSQANLIQASDGNFYGTTHAGGAHGYGTIFKITPQ